MGSKSIFGTVRRLPSGRYQVRVTVAGQQVSVGTFATRRDAAAAMTNPTPARRGSPVSLSSWTETWLATRVGHRPTTQHRDRLIITAHVLRFFGDPHVESITTMDVQAWVNHLAERLAPSTVQRSFTVLAQLLGGATDVGVITVNPAIRIRRPRRVRYEARFLTPNELERLADATPAPWRAMVLVMAYGT